MEYNLVTAMEEMKQGKEPGLNYIYAKTYNYVYLRAKNVLKRENDVQQLMKDVYLKMLESSEEVQVENLYEWLGKCVYRLGCKYYRRKKAREEACLEIDKSEASPRKSVDLDQTTYVIQKRLEELPDLYQATFYAFYYDYMAVEDIAEVMDCTAGIIINRLNYTRKYMIKALETYQEEKKVKVAYSVEAVCVALRKWSIDHCLGITTAQNVYSEICKAAKLQASPVYLEGKEFAGVNNTVVYHKVDEYEPLLAQFEAYGKKPGVDPKVIRLAAGAVVGVIILILAIVLFTGNGKEKEKGEDKTDANQVEEQQKPETNDEQNTDAEAGDAQGDEQQNDEPQTGDESQEPEQDSQSQTGDASEYILPDSATRLLTEEDLSGLTKEQLRLARNEMFARHGMIFGVEDLDSYFATKSWYQPTYTSDEFYDHVEMSMVEEQNLVFIQSFE